MSEKNIQPDEGWGRDFLRGALEHQAKVSVERFGTGEAKTFEHLYRELMEDESQLFLGEKGEALRSVNFLSLDVLYRDEDGIVWKLVEDRQEFFDGRVRRRPKMPGSLGEKMHPDEDPMEGAKRALQEELGVEIKGDLAIRDSKKEEETSDSQSYPGLQTKFTIYKLQIVLPPDQYRPEGYTERQKDKTTYFKWVRQEPVA